MAALTSVLAVQLREVCLMTVLIPHDVGTSDGSPSAALVWGYLSSEHADDIEPDLKFRGQLPDVRWPRAGWNGSHPEMAWRCSADGGEFFSVYWR